MVRRCATAVRPSSTIRLASFTRLNRDADAFGRVEIIVHGFAESFQ
jgi:hypothetical protein